MGAYLNATSTLMLRFTRLDIVNSAISPAPRSKPSVIDLSPMKTKKYPTNFRYPMPVLKASLPLLVSRNIEIIGLWNIAMSNAIITEKEMIIL